jgi:hypothetical protein
LRTSARVRRRVFSKVWQLLLGNRQGNSNQKCLLRQKRTNYTTYASAARMKVS